MHSGVFRWIGLLAFCWRALAPVQAAAQIQPLRPIASAEHSDSSALSVVRGPRSVISDHVDGELQSATAHHAPATAGAGALPATTSQAAPPAADVEKMLSPGGLSATLKLMLVLSVLSLAPSILMMTTCFVRFVVVLSLLRQALGTQQLPPNQVVASLCLFLTFMVMAPVWRQAYEQGIAPYTAEQPLAGQMPGEDRLARAFINTVRPLRRFMSDQIEMTGNSDSVWMFLHYHRPPPNSPEAQIWKEPETYDDLPLSVLLPAYMLSELKTAFVIGFQIYLPFLVIDLVISAVLISMGMMMLPPMLISLPFKLLLFVMIDGWYLTVGMLLESVRPFG